MPLPTDDPLDHPKGIPPTLTSTEHHGTLTKTPPHNRSLAQCQLDHARKALIKFLHDRKDDTSFWRDKHGQEAHDRLVKMNRDGLVQLSMSLFVRSADGVGRVRVPETVVAVPLGVAQAKEQQAVVGRPWKKARTD